MGIYSDLFKFAAKAGSLEGYLFKRGEIESLENWINNILSMHDTLSIEARKEIRADLLVVLNRIMEYGSQTVPATLKEKIDRLVTRVNTDI